MTRKSRVIGITALAAVCVASVCALSACGGGTKTIDYTKYTESQWLAEEWDEKDISYQFTGNYSQDDGSGSEMAYDVLLNLYDDSGAYAVVLTSGIEFDFVGYWSEAEDEDGNVITITVEYGTDLNYENNSVADSLLAYAPTTGYNGSYTIYEMSGGNYSFGFYFWMSPGQYYRSATMKGSSTVTYATTDDFRTAKASSSTGGNDTTTFTAASGDITLTGAFEMQGVSATGYLALNYDGTWIFNDTLTSGMQTLSGTYTYTNGILELTESGNSDKYTAEAVTDEEGYTLTIPVISSMDAYCTITYTDSDIALPAVTLTTSFEFETNGMSMSFDASLYLFSDNSWVLSNSLYGRTGTYSVSENVITLYEDTDTSSAYATATESSGTYTLDVTILSAISASCTFTYSATDIAAISGAAE